MEKSPEFRPVEQNEGAFDLSAFEAQQKQNVSEEIKVTKWTSPALLSPLDAAKKISRLIASSLPTTSRPEQRDSRAVAETLMRHLASMTALKRKAYKDAPSDDNKKSYLDSATRLMETIKKTFPDFDDAQAKSYGRELLDAADRDKAA